MGFMDRAKKMADQAQSKLDEVQKNFNERQQGGEADPPTAASPAGEDPRPHGDPLLSDEPGSRQGADAEREAERPSGGGAPGMTSGDPLG